jgi:pimeloyl-ACP methyl ester carboxylesterase
MQPETRYAKNGDIHIAYQVIGKGSVDLVYVPGFTSHIGYAWEFAPYARFLLRLAGFSRLIWFDKRGTGLSDRVAIATLEERMDDVRAVMEAAGSERAVLFGQSEGGPMCALFAATYPERTAGLIMYATFARRLWAADYPWAPTASERQRYCDEMERSWGRESDLISVSLPSVAGDGQVRAWYASYERFSASPGAAVAVLRMNSEIDVRHILPAIRVPTLVLHRTGDRDVRVEEGRYIAGQIPHARFVELPGADHDEWIGDPDSVLAEVEEFVTGVRPVPEPDRVLATVLFTDVAGATERAAALGDRAWRDVLERHHAAVRKQLARFRGREIDTAGDGVFAAFDGPARAVRCALAVRADAPPLGLSVRAGVHAGECQVMGDKLAGIAVHIGARVAAQAAAGEVLVTSTVRDLVAGSGLTFADRGGFALRGVPGEWRLFAADG